MTSNDDSIKTEITSLLNKLEKQPNNVDILNSIALWYMENSSMQNIADEELEFFELAYSTSRTIKTSHNLAWYLYFETDLKDRAISIQEDSIKLNPKSYLPYYLYGYMLLEKEGYDSAIYYLSKSNSIKNRRDVLHNIGFCYFKLGDYKEALSYFTISANEEDIENRSLFNKALTAYKINDLGLLKDISIQLFSEIENKVHKEISGYEVALLFYLLKDYEKVAESFFKQGSNGIDLFEWKEISYSLFLVDNEIWNEIIIDRINKKLIWVKEIETNHEDGEDCSDDEKKEQLKVLQNEIKLMQYLLENGIEKPEPQVELQLLVEYCGCLLFDCKRHGNRKDDNM